MSFSEMTRRMWWRYSHRLMPARVELGDGRLGGLELCAPARNNEQQQRQQDDRWRRVVDRVRV